MTIFLGVIGLFATLSWVIAVIQAVQIVRLAPKGERLGSYFALGWWKFDKIEAMAGSASVPHLQIYKRAVAAFLVFVVLGVVLSGWAATRTVPPASASSEPQSITDPRVMPADFAFNDIRRVATMPGVPVLES